MLPDTLVANLLLAVPPTDAEQASGVLARARKDIMRRVAGEPGAAIRTLRADDAAWQSLRHGVERLIVHAEGPFHTWLLRLAPGASLPAHGHDFGDEESFILSGSCVLNGERLQAGDYHQARHGSQHDRLTTEEGCMFWLRLPAAQAHAMLGPATR